MTFDILSPSAQVARHLGKLIIKGQWERHLPGTPALSQEIGVDRKTVTAAIEMLEEQGLLESQGAGRPRKIVITEKQRVRGMRITILVYEEKERHELYLHKLHRLLSAAGHLVTVSKRSLTDLGMQLPRVVKYVSSNPSEIWIPTAASKEILEWFAAQPFHTMALFGRRRGVPIAGIGPDKTEAIRQMTEKLIQLGHQRIVLFSREERKKPTLGLQERTFLATLEAHGIKHGSYNLPDWKNDAGGFKECLERLLEVTPPTALLIDESQFLVAALLHLARRGISVPGQISVFCTDDDFVFQMCDPHVSCIRWPTDPVVKRIVKWVQQVSRGKVTRKQYHTPARIVEGGTIGPPLGSGLASNLFGQE